MEDYKYFKRAAVLSQLLEREALAKSMRRERRKNMPKNPTSLQELAEVPDKFKRTFLDEAFLLYDSRDDEDQDQDDEPRDRVLVFSTRRNIDLLCRSRTWFLDGTFKTSPSLFTQIFTILGLRRRRRNIVHGYGEGLAVPLVYALLTRKTTEQYAAVLRVVQRALDEYNLTQCDPKRFTCDFEKSILNACADVFPAVDMSCCFFHLSQSLYRRVQDSGLQVQYKKKFAGKIFCRRNGRRRPNGVGNLSGNGHVVIGQSGFVHIPQKFFIDYCCHHA